MPPTNFLSQIQQLGKEIIPVDGHLYLYGSRARGDSPFYHNVEHDKTILI